MYSTFHHIDTEGWSHSDTVRFCLAVKDGMATDETKLLLRTVPDFPFKNLSLIVSVTAKDDNKSSTPRHIRTDTIECSLTDSNGRIGGKGLMHREFEYKWQGLRGIYADSVCVAITHNMQRSMIEGVEDIGIEIR